MRKPVIKQGTRKLLDATRTDLKSMAGTLKSNVLDRLGDEKTKLSVYARNISTAPLNTLHFSRERLQNRQQRYEGLVNRYPLEKAEPSASQESI